MKPIEERLDEIRHVHIDLEPATTSVLEADPQRPELQLWADVQDDVPMVVLMVGPMFGQQHRFISLLPVEARALGEALLDMARRVEREISFDRATAAVRAEGDKIVAEIKAHRDAACDCGAETEGKWADKHSPGCQVLQMPASHTDAFHNGSE
jgi:hypothetical protein